MFFSVLWRKKNNEKLHNHCGISSVWFVSFQMNVFHFRIYIESTEYGANEHELPTVICDNDYIFHRFTFFFIHFWWKISFFNYYLNDRHIHFLDSKSWLPAPIENGNFQWSIRAGIVLSRVEIKFYLKTILIL